MKCFAKLFGAWVLAMVCIVLVVAAFVAILYGLASFWSLIVPAKWVMPASSLTLFGVVVAWIVYTERKNICSDDCP